MPLAAGTRLGPYEILSPLGAGGMGEVYRARDSRLERDVAIKVLPEQMARDSQAMARFEREAKAVAALSHPNILSIFDVGAEQGISYAVTELLEGETLRGRLSRSPLDWRKAAELVATVADGLAAAHAKGITHRDLKPENIFLTADGRVKILDFGLARWRPREPGSPDAETETATGAVMGTMGYMSPEQIRGERADAPSDLFSLGCVLYEMIAGRRPFARPSPADTLAAILNSDPAPLTGVPPELDRLITRCLQKNWQQRFQSAADLAFDLQALKEGVGGRGSGVRVRVAAAAVVVLALVAALAWFLLGRSGAAIDSLAVLPFANAGGDPNAEYLSDGITETIISSLSQLPRLRVISPSIAFRYKGKAADPQKTGRDLNVRAVLTGRLVQRGDTLIVSADLVDVADGSQLWGQQYNRKLADILAVQEEISREISDKLRLRLTGEEQKRLTRRRPQDDQAYRLYLQGRYHWNRRTEESLRKSIEYFEKAIEQDPGYALAYAGMADSYGVIAGQLFLPPAEAFPKAKAAAIKAIQIDETLAEPHASLGWVALGHDWDWPKAEKEFRRAIEIDPGYATAHGWFAFYLVAMGRFDDGIAQGKLGVNLDPLSPVLHSNLAVASLKARRYDAAIEECRQALELEPNFVQAFFWRGMAFAHKGMHAQAIADFKKAIEVGGEHPRVLSRLAQAHAMAGNRGEAAKLLQRLKDEAQRRYVSADLLAFVHVALGQRDQAFEWLEKAVQERSPWLFFLKVDPSADPLRSDPRFPALLRRIGLPP